MKIATWRAYQILDKDLRRRLVDTESNEYRDCLDRIVSVQPGPQTRSTLGLVPPSPAHGELAHHSTGGTVLLMARISERLLPRAVIVDEVARRGAKMLRQEGQDRKELSRKEFAQVRDSVIAELLPKSHIKNKLVPVLIRGQYIVIGASSTKVCEDLLNRLRFAFGTLKVIPFDTKQSASEIMRRLLRGTLEQDELSDISLELGSRAKLDHKEGAQITVKGEDLKSNHVQELLDDGYHPIELSMHGMRDDTQVVKFVVNKSWVFKSFKPSIDPEDVSGADFGADEEAEHLASMAQFDANLILTADTIFTTIDTVVDAAGALDLKDKERAYDDMWASLNKASDRQGKQVFRDDGRRGDTPVWVHDPQDMAVFLGKVADLDTEGYEEITGGLTAANRLRVEYGLPPVDENGHVVDTDDNEDLSDL